MKIPVKNLKIYDNIKEANAITNSEHDIIMPDGLFNQAREIEHREEWYTYTVFSMLHTLACRKSKRPASSILHFRSMDNGLSSTL